MKRLNKLIVSAFILAVTTISAWSLEAKIVSLTGKVEIQTDGATWKAAKVGDVLKKGALISTGFKSSASIVIDNATVNLDAMTRITIEKLASNNSKNQTNLYLNNGKVSADVKKTAGKKVDFKVSSAASTASVRGTSFTFYANGRLETTEGLVSKGPGKKAAEISETDEADPFLPEDGESTVTTSTTEVSGAKEIPVAAGQTSTTDPLSGLSATPQEESSKKKNPSRGHGTESIADRESGSSLAPEQDNPFQSIPEIKTGGAAITIYDPDQR